MPEAPARTPLQAILADDLTIEEKLASLKTYNDFVIAQAPTIQPGPRVGPMGPYYLDQGTIQGWVQFAEHFNRIIADAGLGGAAKIVIIGCILTMTKFSQADLFCRRLGLNARKTKGTLRAIQAWVANQGHDPGENLN